MKGNRAAHKNGQEDILRARVLRNNASPIEKKLWEVLSRQAKVNGVRFRRQHPVHPYVADFACLSVHVLVEIDGNSHDMRQAYDAQRDAYLRDQGYDVLRFSNENVKMNVEGVVATILDFVELKSKKLGIAIAAPPRGGLGRGTLRPISQNKRKTGQKMLEIKNLHAGIEGRDILKGLDFTLPDGEVHAIMGPNGAGKSTLSYVLAGRAGYNVKEGSATLNGQDLLAMTPDARAAAGVFLAFQYPVEIPGVTNMSFLKTAVNAVRRARGEKELDAMQMLKMLRGKAKDLGMSEEMLKRAVNVGFSGGEKKRNEVLQMAVLEPRLCILDETDSGLDIDALRIVADGVNALRGAGRSMLVITHYQRLLDYIKPDRVHVLAAGRIEKSGGPELALELEEKGYGEVKGAQNA